MADLSLRIKATRYAEFNLYSFRIVNDRQFAFTSEINETSTRKMFNFCSSERGSRRRSIYADALLLTWEEDGREKKFNSRLNASELKYEIRLVNWCWKCSIHCRIGGESMWGIEENESNFFLFPIDLFEMKGRNFKFRWFNDWEREKMGTRGRRYLSNTNFVFKGFL